MLSLLASACLALGAASPSAAPHDLHLSHTRMVIEGNTIVARTRMFRDDLEKALGQPIGDTPASRETVRAYLTRHFVLTVGGKPLAAELLDSGGEMDGDQPVWWVLVQWKAPAPVRTLGVRVHLMFETFRDQQNTVLVARNPGDERRGLYFQAGDLAEQVLKF
ncbi:MAG: hypothetical protein FJ363_05420 [Gemmatimonadetes bacterium]|nr:hypothetical protein [Gemmatimonadota bacterium]